MNPDSQVPEPTLKLADGERMERNKAILLDALKQSGATQATVGYRGGGDEGIFDEVAASAIDATPVLLEYQVSVLVKNSRHVDREWHHLTELSKRPLDEALSDFAMEAVSKHHGGWEINEGGSGEVIFDCSADTVRIEHNRYFCESEYTETVL